MKLLDCFLSLFKKKQIVQPKQVESPGVKMDKYWIERATLISMDFEGNEPWSNITGNFDGMGLTCGALGWTFGFGDQQRLVRLFVELHGLSALLDYMPKHGETYWKYCTLSNEEGTRLVSAWSNKEVVNVSFKADLKTLWTSVEMVEIQKGEIEKTIGKYASDTSMQFCKDHLAYTSKEWILDFKLFAFFFDVRVLNGSMKGLTVVDALKLNRNLDDSVRQVIQWCKMYSSGYQIKDTRKSGEVWEALMNQGKLDYQSKVLLVLGWLRSCRAKTEFMGTVMCRRGIMATGIGYTEGELKQVY